jgi:hypothetical protein
VVLDDVAAWIASLNVGLTVGTNLFRGDLPPTPTHAVGLFESPGPAPTTSFSGVEMERPHVQVLVRDADYDVGRVLLERIHQAALGFRARAISGQGVLLAIMPIGTPGFAFREETPDKSPVFSLNLEVWKPLSTLPT